MHLPASLAHGISVVLAQLTTKIDLKPDRSKGEFPVSDEEVDLSGRAISRVHVLSRVSYPLAIVTYSRVYEGRERKGRRLRYMASGRLFDDVSISPSAVKYHINSVDSSMQVS